MSCFVQNPFFVQIHRPPLHCKLKINIQNDQKRASSTWSATHEINLVLLWVQLLIGLIYYHYYYHYYYAYRDLVKMDSGRSLIPDRWLGCPSYGDLIDDTFLPMKTLLSDDAPLPPDYKFTPNIFVQQMRDRKIDVGLIINLSYSSRYYDGNDLIDDHNLEYRQISCRGFNEAPQDKERNEFVRVCSSFLAKNPRKVIAVHCTHGFNRTGFMICYFLCAERDWAVEAAVKLFANMRPPGIYKQEYLNELFNLYADSDDPVMEAPPKPDWDSEMMIADLQARDDEQVNSVPQKEFYEGITDVHLVRDETMKRKIYAHCCMLCNFEVRDSHVTFPGAQPVSMDQQNILLLKANRYRVSWKADGCRYMMYIQDEDNIFFLCRSLHLWRVVGLKFPKIDDQSSHISDTLLDGEMVTDIENGKKVPRYLIFDVISLNGSTVATQNFIKRHELIRNVIIKARHNAKFARIASKLPVDVEPFKVAEKGFFFIHDSKKTLHLEQVTHEIDGLIYQPVDAPYIGGTCPAILKWKPPNLNSIDFRIIIREERSAGCLPESYAHLYVSNNVEICKFKLDKDRLSYHQYNNKIVEMARVNGRWTILRERTDKLTANSYNTYVAVMNSIRHPVTEEDLLGFIEKLPREPKR